MKAHPSERRRHPRVKKELALKVATDGYDFSTQTKDLSCIGAYCYVDKFIPPMTKLSVKLMLPAETVENNSTQKVQCKGVVVRTDACPPGGFNIAIFFNQISVRSKDKISQYVNRLLTQINCAL